MSNITNRHSPTTREKVEAFEQGRLARQRGMDQLNCPYPEGGILADKWGKGYMAVRAEELQKLHQHGHGSE